MNKGFSILIVVSIIAALLLASTATYIILKKDPEPIQQKTTEQKIKEVVLENTNHDDFKITHISDKFSRGEINIDGENKTVYLALIGDIWKIIDISEQPISCERFERIGFPAIMITDCLYQSPNAKTPTDIKYNSKDDLLSQENIQIIGNLAIGNEPSSGTFQIIDENNESMDVNIGNFDPNNFENISENDYVVIDVGVSENNDGELEFNLENVEKIELGETSNISTEYDNEDSDQSSAQTSDNSTDITDLNLSEEIYYDITDLPPGSAANLEEYYKSLVDRDFSDREVEIISDF